MTKPFTSLLEDLRKQLQNADAVRTDEASLLKYGRDWTRYYDVNARAIVFPENTQHVVTIVQWARKNQISIVPSGGRTGLSGGAVAKNGEVVLSLEKMNAIKNWNPFDLTVECEAGVITEELQNFAREKGYQFPVDFAARGSSQIGGNIATNAGGINVVRYGMMREWVADLVAVTGTGEILRVGKSLIKNATGYDLKHLLIGSEGTLAIVTEATLRVTTPPPPTWVLVLGVPGLDHIMDIFQTFRDKIKLAAFEMFTEQSLQLVLEHHGGLQRPFETATPVYLLIEVELEHESGQATTLELFETCLEKGWVADGIVSQSPQQARELWKLREFISESCSHYTPYKNDISVTISRATTFMAEASQLITAQYPHFRVIWFGHIGDGNLHINILRPKEMSKEEFVASCQKVDRLLFELIAKLDGSISAEHGVGLSKKPFLNYTRSAVEIEILRGIKRVFDPDGILNPGKIFDSK